MSNLLSISNIYKIFNEGESNEVRALNDVNLQFGYGEFVLIVGNNGSGKSTLLNVLDGRIRQTSGVIEVNDKSIDHLKVYQRSKFFFRLFQETWHGVIPQASIYENLAFAKKRNTKYSLFRNLADSNYNNEFKEVVSEYNPMLANNMSKKIFTLSPGERQAIILSLLKLQVNSEPQILLADEPTASLDPEMAKKSINTIKILAKKGWLCLVVTHDNRLINDHSGRLIRLNEGSIEYGA